MDIKRIFVVRWGVVFLGSIGRNLTRHGTNNIRRFHHIFRLYQ